MDPRYLLFDRPSPIVNNGFVTYRDSFEESQMEPTLPALPALPALSNIDHRPPLVFFGRKRCRDEQDNQSSDPPVFSSDDQPSGSENYHGHRDKRQYQGTWWGERVEQNQSHANNSQAPRQKREFKRAIDSGVWMGSDDTVDLDEDSDLAGGKGGPLKAFHNPHDEDSSGENSVPAWLNNPAWTSSQYSSTERALRSIAQRDASIQVKHCVEEGIEEVDLSGRELGEVLDSTMRPLHYLTLQMPDSLLQEAHRPLTPNISLFLANNSLAYIPGEIFKLQNLTILSLRQNHLTEIPSSIAALHNLSQLNLSSNQLRWLPFSILNLLNKRPHHAPSPPSHHHGPSLTSLNHHFPSLNYHFPPTTPSSHLRTMWLHPNPFVEPASRHSGLPLFKESPLLRRPHEPFRPLFRSTIAYLDINGLTARGSPPAPSSTALREYRPSAASKRTLYPASFWAANATRVPSLLALALKECAKSPLLKELPGLLPGDAPEGLSRLLMEAWRVRDWGGQTCTICGREFVVPRTEWIEWWSGISHSEIEPVPLIRKGCSWICVEDGDSGGVGEEERGCGWLAPG